jgi:hypothetical protein
MDRITARNCRRPDCRCSVWWRSSFSTSRVVSAGYQKPTRTTDPTMRAGLEEGLK